MAGCDSSGCTVKLVEDIIETCYPCGTIPGRRTQVVEDDELLLLTSNITFSVTAYPMNVTNIIAVLNNNFDDINTNVRNTTNSTITFTSLAVLAEP
eukprot:scaffold25571_cov45-Cyclotella_meneghiniana.AAC.1